MYDLTRHFEDQWKKRVGGQVPSRQLIDLLIADSIKLQAYRKCQTPRGRAFVVLGLYWNVEQGMIFKVDDSAMRVVTVITKSTKEEEQD